MSPVSGTADRALAGSCWLKAEKLSSIDSAQDSQAETSSTPALLLCRRAVVVHDSARHRLKSALKSSQVLLSIFATPPESVWHIS